MGHCPKVWRWRSHGVITSFSPFSNTQSSTPVSVMSCPFQLSCQSFPSHSTIVVSDSPCKYCTIVLNYFPLDGMSRWSLAMDKRLLTCQSKHPENLDTIMDSLNGSYMSKCHYQTVESIYKVYIWQFGWNNCCGRITDATKGTDWGREFIEEHEKDQCY